MHRDSHGDYLTFVVFRKEGVARFLSWETKKYVNNE